MSKLREYKNWILGLLIGSGILYASVGDIGVDAPVDVAKDIPEEEMNTATCGSVVGTRHDPVRGEAFISYAHCKGEYSIDLRPAQDKLSNPEVTDVEYYEQKVSDAVGGKEVDVKTDQNGKITEFTITW